MPAPTSENNSETQLESAIAHVIATVFPWVPTGEIKHQVGFTVRLGHGPVHAAGKESWTKRGRADIIISRGGTPLAVVELKRPGLTLLAEDDDQALSYARLLTPMPPLVIVTNGSETRLIETATANSWIPKGKYEEAFEALMHNAAKVAAGDRKRAIETLMGSGPDVWPQAVRLATQQVIAELSANDERPTLPLSAKFSIPREAAGRLAICASSAGRLTLLRGDPMIGKTNVVAQFAQSYSRDEGAVLLLEQSAAGIYRNVADLLARALDWPASAEEARDWLRRVSQHKGSRLVVVFDSFDVSDAAAKQVVEELTSSAFGKWLHVILCLDGAAAAAITQTNGRNESVIGRRATTVDVGPLSDEEFGRAIELLNHSNLGVMRGGQYAPELRQPWLLQAYVTRFPEVPPGSTGVIPSVLSTDIINITRARFKDPELRRRFRGLARAAIQDAKDQSRPAGMILELLYRYVIQRSSVDNYLHGNDVNWLLNQGYLTAGVSGEGIPVLSVRLPELVASELSLLLSIELADLLRDDPEDAAEWLSGAASNFAFGDVIAAQTVFDLERSTGKVSFELIAGLVHRPPEATTINPGARFLTLFEGQLIPVDVPSVDQAEGDGTADIDDAGELIGDFHPWMILAHLASQRAMVDLGQGEQRLDAEILLTVGKSKYILRPPRGDLEFAFPSHELPSGEIIACHEAGIVEAPTLFMLRYLRNEAMEEAREFVDSALAEESPALIARLHIALRMLAEGGDEDRANWARVVLDTEIIPKAPYLQH